jgi:DNA-binding CsgD family transcriptional regulator
MSKAEPERAPAWLSGVRSADGLFTTDAEQRIIDWSTGAERLTGVPAEAALGRHCYEALAVNPAVFGCGPACRPVLEARRGRTVAHHDIVAHRPDGRALPLRTSVLIVDPDSAASDAPAAPLLVHVIRPRINSARSRAAASAPASAALTGEPVEDVPPLAAPLSPREIEVLRLLALGRTTRRIAETLTISPLTARNHILNIERKLGAHNRVEAIHLAVVHDLL